MNTIIIKTITIKNTSLLLLTLLTLTISANLSAASKALRNAQWQGAVVYSAFNTMGSGVPVSPCHILTNEHVIRGSKNAKVRIEGRRYPASVVATDEPNDIALLKIKNCPVKHYAKLSPVAPQNGEILTSVYYQPGFNFFRRMTRTKGKLVGIQSIVTEENKRMTSLSIDDPHPYLRASGGGVFSTHGLVSVIFGITPGRSKRRTYAVSYHSLKKFLQQNHLYSSGTKR